MTEEVARGQKNPESTVSTAALAPLYEVVGQLKQSGWTETEIAEALTRTGPDGEDELAVVEDILGRRDDGKRIGDALAARREGAKCCSYRSFDYGNSCRCVLVEGHEGPHIV